MSREERINGPPDLVIKDVGPETRIGLRFVVEFPLQSPDRVWCFQAHRQSPHLARFENTPEVRGLPSTGITRLRRYYAPVRLPHRPMPCSTVEAATLVQRGSPPLARSPVSTCRAHYPGGPVQLHLSAASPNRAAFPVLRAGRRPQLPFRGLLRLYTHYGPSIRSTARSDPSGPASPARGHALSQGFDPASYPTKPPASYRANRPLPGWDLHPRGYRAVRDAPESHGIHRYHRVKRPVAWFHGVEHFSGSRSVHRYATSVALATHAPGI